MPFLVIAINETVGHFDTYPRLSFNWDFFMEIFFSLHFLVFIFEYN